MYCIMLHSIIYHKEDLKIRSEVRKRQGQGVRCRDVYRSAAPRCARPCGRDVV